MASNCIVFLHDFTLMFYPKGGRANHRSCVGATWQGTPLRAGKMKGNSQQSKTQESLKAMQFSYQVTALILTGNLSYVMKKMLSFCTLESTEYP